MKALMALIFGYQSKNKLGVYIDASKNTMGTAGGAIMEITSWVYKK
jgi:hypothetical protein